MLSRRFRCPKCGSLEGYRSRFRGWAERLFLPLLLLRPARCGDCFRRSYHFLFVRVANRDELQMVTHVMNPGVDALHAAVPGLYTDKDSSGPSPSTERTTEVRLQQ